ncbi:GvpL/GvpF family gas vesicle protein [Nocardiopsis lambiniae]|uniref:GvpL/GvpF family gas vesicle protein n=1 Tax=Nocardiopsis lambiniae TaxID=3075539 RepID=A0ABU2M828_9ACTN|nr:GvpL/GvpF family gas vesicle protein [Nocardiopsis sp. DSM 44743]MDT0328310.1 GvpL/GvpF family gas vesicle protein [Nocardiopsis sp. DSM 44743]
MNAGLYVYGILRDSSLPEEFAFAGVGDPPGEVTPVRAAGLAAAVSPAPEDLRPRRRDLVAHQKVLEALIALGPVLPLRFGVVAEGEGSVAEELERSRERYENLLSEVEGRVEVNVKAFHDEDRALRVVLERDERLRDTNRRLREADGGSIPERMDFGEAVVNAVEELAAADAEAIVRALSGVTDRLVLGSSAAVAGCLVNVSLLVDQEGVKEVERVTGLLDRELAHVSLGVNGPLPPYSFVTGPDEPDPATGDPM